MRHGELGANWQLQRGVVEMFSKTPAAGLFEVTINDLRWLAEAGYCEDLTSRITQWSQLNNIYAVAAEGVMLKDRVYGLPFHCSLTGLAYNQDVLSRLGIWSSEVVSSPESLVEGVAKASREGTLRQPFWATNVRILLMHFLKAYYEDLTARFADAHAKAIERDVAYELFDLVKRLKYEFGARIPTFADPLTEDEWNAYYKDMGSGAIPFALTQFIPQSVYRRHGSGGAEIQFRPFCFGPDHKPCSFFNGYVWIINPRISLEQREFLWSVLSNYVTPQTELDLDLLYIRKGKINGRSNAFISTPGRMPGDAIYEHTHAELFSHAQPEIPYPSAAFDMFVFAVSRALFEEDGDFSREYDFYCAMLEQGRIQGSNDVFGSMTTYVSGNM